MESSGYIHLESQDMVREELYLALIKEIKSYPFKPDVFIECKDGEFHVHKHIFSSKSTYFWRKMNESNCRYLRFHFPSVQRDVMVAILYFIYFQRDVLPNDFDFLVNSVKTANSFELKSFSNTCYRHLEKLLNISNYLDMWKLVKEYKNYYIEYCIIEFVRNKADKILSSPEFLQKEAKELNSLLPVALKGMATSDNLWKGIKKWIKYKDGRNVFLELRKVHETSGLLKIERKPKRHYIKKCYFLAKSKPLFVIKDTTVCCTIQ